jgi:probable F420-dependent oxidoreductase
MQIGVVFPQTEIGADHGGVRAYAAGIEEAGYRHVLAYDHVLGADPASYPGWSGPYNVHDTFHEPLTLFAFLAGITGLEFVSGVLIMPQRQTVLVAKQAAAVDILSGGRLRLGIGIGWNAVEYEALDRNFSDRGRRMDEQIVLMRRLWTEPVVDFEGRDHVVRGAGIAPLPVQRPIPIWIGSRKDERGLRRVGRLADGWIPLGVPGEEFLESREVVRAAAVEAGRDPDSLGIEGRIEYGDGDIGRIGGEARAWRDAGASYLAVNTMRAGLGGPDGHVAALQAIAGVLSL